VSAREFWSTADRLEAASVPFVVVTMLSTRGHAPQDPGAKAIVTVEGLHWGTVGGGKVEAKAILLAKELLETGGPRPELRVVTWNLQRDVGMTCGGEVTYLFETHRADGWKVVVFGAGHVAQALVRLLAGLECRVTCIDPRPEWTEKMPESSRVRVVLTEDPPAQVAGLEKGSYFVVMTRGHATDLPVLQEIYRKHPDAPYIGLIGSDVKALKVRAELREMGFGEELVAKLRCPMGLPLGGNDPNEIAISIAAELIQVRDGKMERP
jgi:xanthine dehydrogenase accessory factor